MSKNQKSGGIRGSDRLDLSDYAHYANAADLTDVDLSTYGGKKMSVLSSELGKSVKDVLEYRLESLERRQAKTRLYIKDSEEEIEIFNQKIADIAVEIKDTKDAMVKLGYLEAPSTPGGTSSSPGEVGGGTNAPPTTPYPGPHGTSSSSGD